jgi:hypothetical protein
VTRLLTVATTTSRYNAQQSRSQKFLTRVSAVASNVSLKLQSETQINSEIGHNLVRVLNDTASSSDYIVGVTNCCSQTACGSFQSLMLIKGKSIEQSVFCSCHFTEYYPSSCLLFKTQLNSIGLSVPNRKHITSPLRAQQVSAIYRLVTMVY